MKNYKVCIPTAGTGSRVSEFTSGLNKSLLEINNKPVISYIITHFQKASFIPTGFDRNIKGIFKHCSF